MSDRLALATRTMRARRTSVCPSCRGPVLIGQRIARLTDPAAWVHVRCIPAVAALNAAAAVPAPRMRRRERAADRTAAR